MPLEMIDAELARQLFGVVLLFASGTLLGIGLSKRAGQQQVVSARSSRIRASRPWDDGEEECP